MKKQHVSSGAAWESRVGYCRAVRIGSTIAVSGTVASDGNGCAMFQDDAGAQARECLQRIASALAELGASLEHVIRTRIYVVNIARDWEAVGSAHSSVFQTIRPATTMVEVGGLIDPGFLVEIEADAVFA